jgi:hypothetical protein
MELPAHVSGALGIGTQATEEELANAADAGTFTRDVFGLSGQEFATAAVLGLSTTSQFQVVRATRPTREWKYLELLYGGTVECTAVITPDESVAKPPTAAGQALAAAWFTIPTVIDGMAITPQAVISAYPVGGTLFAFSSRLVREWSDACPVFEGSAVVPAWVSRAQIAISGNGRIDGGRNNRHRFAALFLEAVSEAKAKWRFLSTYRVLEHGYLAEVFQTIQSGFFTSPRETLEIGLDSLGSEIKQFVALVDASGLQTQFETFHDRFEQCKTAGNMFAVALDRSMTKSGQVKQVQGKWQKGVLIFYKVRCSVVHAGITSPMFDAYADGTACLEALLPTCEQVMLAFLGIEVA